MKLKLTMLFLVLAALAVALSYGTRPTKAATTLLVDDDNAQCPTAMFTTIQSAVNAAAPGDTVQVCPGTYNENVTIPITLTLNGAQAGTPVAGRTFGGPSESKVVGVAAIGAVPVIKITAPDVTVDGFSVTDSVVTTGAAVGIGIKSSGNRALVTNNIIDGVRSTDPGGNGTAQAVYLEAGPDNVRLAGNRMTNVQSVRSAKGVLIGDSGSTDPSQNVLIDGNSIENVTSTNRGAYAVQLNNGNGSTSNTGLVIRDNAINKLTGGSWAHAIGLEANTPGAFVTSNSISNVTDTNCVGADPGANCFFSAVADAIAVWFEANPSYFTGQVHNNNFDNVDAGIVVQPGLNGGSVNGACNWWGSSDGPGPVGPGSGAKVSPNVVFTPWLTSPAPGGACAGPDADNDGVTDSVDNCPFTPNPGQEDSDGDGTGDACDACPLDAQNDVDGDGVCGNVDNCPTVANAGQANFDGDSMGDACDTDDDNDGVLDGNDACPGTPLGTPVGSNGCPKAVNKDQCKNDGWKTLFRADGTGFKNQGDCVSYVSNGK